LPQGWRLDLPKEMEAGEQWGLIVRFARKVEELGFDSLWVYDHFVTRPGPFAGRSVFEAFTTLAALAPLTKRVRLGTLVACILYRNPAYLAKIASVLDVVSGGRLELGLGACWYEADFRAYGYEMPRPGVRVDMLEEAVQIIKALWTQPEVTFSGRFYRLEKAHCDPKPLQKPHPPIMIAGGGERKMLRVVAKYADKWNFNRHYGPEVYARKLEVLKRYCEEVGRRVDDIVLTHFGFALVGKSEEEIRRQYEMSECLRLMGISYEEIRRMPYVGTPEEVAEWVERFRKLGVREIYLHFLPAAWDMSPLELFRDEVMHQFR